jgi:hypothetical protein
VLSEPPAGGPPVGPSAAGGGGGGELGVLGGGGGAGVPSVGESMVMSASIVAVSLEQQDSHGPTKKQLGLNGGFRIHSLRRAPFRTLRGPGILFPTEHETSRPGGRAVLENVPPTLRAPLGTFSRGAPSGSA